MEGGCLKIKLIIILIFSFFIFSRVVILDNDLPPRTVTDIYAIDELYYNISAFNLYKYNKLTYQEQLPFKTKNDAGAGNIFTFLLGGLFSILLFNFFIKYSYSINLLDYFNEFKVYSKRLSFDSNDTFLLASAKNMLNFFTTNIFRLNISFLFISLLLFPSFVYKVFKDKKFIDIFILQLLLMQFGQSIFENSYSLRRLTYIYLALLIPSLYLSLRYITPQFNYKDAMIHFSSNLEDNQITIGQASFLFRLYNNSQPVLNWYNYRGIDDNAYKKNFQNAFKEKDVKYTIDFYNKEQPSLLY